MKASFKGGPTLPLLLICLLGNAWALKPSKLDIRETQLKKTRDSVFFRNPTQQPIRINLIEVKPDSQYLQNWEFSVRADRPPVELCFGRGMGTCPPASPVGGFPAGWVVPAMDSLLLYDFNFANCLRCPLGTARTAAQEDTVAVPLVFLFGDSKISLKLSARLGASR